MIEPLIIQYDLHHRLYNNVLEGFTDEESNQRLHQNKNMNHVKYLAGHLLNSQYGFSMIAGLDVDVKWNDLFAAMGQSRAKDDFPYPHIDEIKAEWNRIHPKARKGLEMLGEKDLYAKPIKPLDEIFGTVLEFWSFINHHQAYHIGQISILRRGFGKAPMSYE